VADEPTWLGMPTLRRRDVFRLAGVSAAVALVGSAVEACGTSAPRTALIGQLQELLRSIPSVPVVDALDHEPEIQERDPAEHGGHTAPGGFVVQAVHARSEVRDSPAKYSLPDGRQWPASALVRNPDLPKLLSGYIASLGPTVDTIQQLSRTVREPLPDDAVTKADLPGLPVANGDPVLTFASDVASYWAHPLDDTGRPRTFGDQRIDALPTVEMATAVADLRSTLQTAMRHLPASPAARPS
jgi:hypothetical protein